MSVLNSHKFYVMHNKILLFLITIVLNSVYENCLYAERLSFIQLSESDWRIPTPLTIYKEGGKFLWIGTKDGVYQFNGYNFRHYNKNNTPNSLNGEFTNKIQMDAMGNLWILTNKGIGLYNKEKDCFLKVSQDKEINGPYFSSCLVKNGVVFGGQNKISFYSYETKEITLLKTFEKLKTNLNFNYIFSLDNDKIIVDGEKYILKVDLKKDTISKINCSSVVSCMFVDQQKRIWVGCYDKSLSCYNIDGVKLNEYTHTNSSLSNELILSIEQQDSLLWIGTDGGGINIVNTHTNQIKRIKHIRGNYQSLPSNSINSLHVDANNTIWAGTVRDGIIAIRKNSITSYVEVSEGNKYGLSNPTILSLFQDENEDFIWIGTDGEGINQLSLKDRTFKHYPLTQGLKVISIAQYNKHTLLLSIYTKGLFFFDKDKGTLHPMNINKEQLKSVYCLSKTDINLYNLSPNTILALTDKIYKYQIHTGDIIELQFENHKGTHAILPIGKYKGMFYCYNEAAIFCFNENGSVIQTLFEPNSNNRIKSATIDPSGNIWMVTSQGIQYLSYKGKNIHCINNNLIKNASSIIADKDGKIWMGDGDKLYAYADTTNSLSTFGTTDGVIPNEYIEKSCYVTEQGDILLGGNKGLTIIDADIKFNTKEVSSIVLMKMKIDNKEWNEYDLNNLDTYEVTAGSKSLEIQIAAIEEDILRPKLYKYEIKGDNEQTIQSYSPILKLNTFSPGESNIYVSCSTRSGKWTEPCKIITLVFLLP